MIKVRRFGDIEKFFVCRKIFSGRIAFLYGQFFVSFGIKVHYETIVAKRGFRSVQK